MENMEYTMFSNTRLRELSNEELCHLMVAAQEGSTKAREELILYHIPLVINRVSKRFKNVKCPKNDLLQIGSIGLIKAVDTFDATKDCSFLTYATVVIDNEILMSLRKNNSIFKGYVAVSFFTDYSVLIEKEIEEKDEREWESRELHLLLEQLPSRERKIISLYFGLHEKKYTQQEIADMYGIKQCSVSANIKRSLMYLKDEFQKRQGIDTSVNQVDINHQTLSDWTKQEKEEFFLNLSERQQQIAKLYFISSEETEYTQGEIGTMIGVSTSTVSRELVKIAKKLSTR